MHSCYAPVAQIQNGHNHIEMNISILHIDRQRLRSNPLYFKIVLRLIQEGYRDEIAYYAGLAADSVKEVV